MRRFAFSLFCLAFFSLWRQLSATILADKPNESYQIRIIPNVEIESFDGIQLNAELVLPIARSPTDRFPVLLYANSWAMPKWEYFPLQLHFAHFGYITLGYSARGWYRSGGLIDLGGFLDRRDISSVVDWLLATYPNIVNPDAIGMMGISYGALLSLIGGAFEPRIKVIGALSGPSDLPFALYPEQSVNEVAGRALLFLGRYPFGHEPDYFHVFWDNLRDGRNLSGILEWISDRSPSSFIDRLNARELPVLLSNNFLDRLFRPDQAIEFYQRLKGPKRLDLNQGVHASYEFAQLLHMEAGYLWPIVKDWFDHFLKGINNSVEHLPRVSIQMGNAPPDRLHLPEWPSSLISSFHWVLSPRASRPFGDLSAETFSALMNETDTIVHVTNTHMDVGPPVLADLRQAFIDQPVYVKFHDVCREGALLYFSAPFDRELFLTGTVELSIWVVRSQPAIQLDAYFYVVEDSTSPFPEKGRLISDGTASRRNSSTPKPDPTMAEQISIPFRALAYRVAKGSRIAIGINTYCDLYDEPAKNPYEVTVLYDGPHRSTLRVSVFDPTTKSNDDPSATGWSFTSAPVNDVSTKEGDRDVPIPVDRAF